MKNIILWVIILIILCTHLISAINYDQTFKQGINYLRKKEFLKGIKLLSQIPKTDKSFQYANFNIGMAYYNLGNHSHKFNYYKKAIKTFIQLTNNKYKKDFIYQAKEMLGYSYEGINNLDKAYKYLNEYYKYLQNKGIKPNFTFLYNYGRVLMFLGKFDVAKDSFLEAKKINPDNAYLYFYLGETFLKLDDYTNAKKNYLIAFKKDKLLTENNIALGLFILDIEKNKRGKNLIIYGLKDKEYFYQIKKHIRNDILKKLSFTEILEVFDYHYLKIKALFLTLYITFLKSIVILYNIIFLILLAVIILIFKKKILKLKSK